MTLINTFTTRFTRVLKDLVDVTPDAARAQLHPLLKEPGLAIGYSDPSGKCVLELRSKSYAEKTRFLVNGKLEPFQPIDPTRYAGMTFTSKIPVERELFPYIPEGPLKPTIKVSKPNIAFHNFCFCTPEYKKKYWQKIKYPMLGGDSNVPFDVTHDGLLIGMNLLHGLEVDGKRNEKYIEFVLIFGNSNLIPRDNAGVRDIAFAAFSTIVTGKKDKQQWSFTEFLNSLKAPVEQNVLLLGSYTSEQDEKDFEKLKSCLASFRHNGFMLKDARDLAIQSNDEKLFAAIMCSCFIIVLDTQPSGHLVELQELLTKRFRPVIIIRHKAEPSTAFLEDKILTDNYFRVAVMSEISETELLPHIKWAKEKVRTQIDRYNKINSWRH